ncbi:hypothetical protein BDW42DRAFT_193533 [Aspergillus taichungensis]|uniref:ABM domain-containing protein n=1 Tax=Aspergillus taichungensis TaxID=482145 RepID=A0A2J5HWY3_9EURO|nr:hypothetical protein BDW42DRAFT_193533 [Aspergillus taichungensis]
MDTKDDVMNTISEFIFFQVEPSVKPEDPSSDEGYALLRVFEAAKAQCAYRSSAWGRAIEDESVIVWVVEWTDIYAGTNLTYLKPFVPPNTHIQAVYATVTPSIHTTDTLTANPVTELCALAFESGLPPAKQTKLSCDLVNFRSALTGSTALPEDQRPTSWTMGYVERPGTVPMEKSPTGKAMVYLLAVGWPSVEAHMAAKKTEAFAEGIKPVREAMLGTAPGLGMKHVSFRKI